MRFVILFLFIIICIAACGSQPVDLSGFHNDTYISCTSKLDHSELDYLKSHRHDFQSDLMPSVTVSNVTDIHNKPWTINSFEWTQYSCTEKILP